MQDQAVDIGHLDRYTGGERALNVEVLQLFQGQCREILTRLDTLSKAAPDEATAKNWRESLHALKGAARGIGAFPFADAAASAEKVNISDQSALLEHLHALKSCSQGVFLFIEDFLRG